jgi:hypothetical protein
MRSETVVSRDPATLAAPVDDELVILNPVKGHYLCLDDVGRQIWELLETAQPVGTLCATLGDQYAGEPDVIATDVLAFLRELDEEGLVRVYADESGSSQSRP